jgi:hypothetical protein
MLPQGLSLTHIVYVSKKILLYAQRYRQKYLAKQKDMMALQLFS